VEIAATTVEKWAQVIAEENGFTQASHTIEIFGTCAKCSK
jgi:Fur family ferric uptake transcriptional regulator